MRFHLAFIDAHYLHLFPNITRNISEVVRSKSKAGNRVLSLAQCFHHQHTLTKRVSKGFHTNISSFECGAVIAMYVAAEWQVNRVRADFIEDLREQAHAFA